MSLIDPNEQAALAAYLESGGNITKTAKAGGVSRPTVYKWLGSEEWRKAIHEVTAPLKDQIGERLTLLAHEALDTLQDVMRTANPKAINQVMAAKTVLEAAVRIAFSSDVTNPGNTTNVTIYLPAKGAYEAGIDDNTALPETSPVSL